MTTRSYDALALGALLDRNTNRGQRSIAALSAHSEGRHVCPDCGDEGPHEVQVSFGEAEFCCRACGMQNPLPEIRVYDDPRDPMFNTYDD